MWGHRDKGQCRPGCQEPEARRRHGAHAAPPLGPCAGGSACGPAVTAPGRGPARPAGPQRGWLWHTTGADLQGRTRGLAPSSTTPETQPHETQGHTLKQERAKCANDRRGEDPEAAQVPGTVTLLGPACPAHASASQPVPGSRLATSTCLKSLTGTCGSQLPAGGDCGAGEGAGAGITDQSSSALPSTKAI